MSGSCADLSIVKAKLQFCRWFINSCLWWVTLSLESGTIVISFTDRSSSRCSAWLAFYRVLFSLSAAECSSWANARRFSISSLKSVTNCSLILNSVFCFCLKRQFSLSWHSEWLDLRMMYNLIGTIVLFPNGLLYKPRKVKYYKLTFTIFSFFFYCFIQFSFLFLWGMGR